MIGRLATTPDGDLSHLVRPETTEMVSSDFSRSQLNQQVTSDRLLFDPLHLWTQSTDDEGLILDMVCSIFTDRLYSVDSIAAPFHAQQRTVQPRLVFLEFTSAAIVSLP